MSSYPRGFKPRRHRCRVKFGDSRTNRHIYYLAQTVHEIYSIQPVGCGIFDHFLNFDNCQPEVVSDVISGMVNQDVGMDVCTNYGDSRLKPSKAPFSALF